MIEPIVVYYDTVNRCAVTVKAKKPFYDWINYVDPAYPIVDNDEGTVYLIKDLESKPKIDNWIKKNYGKIFANELNGYHTEESEWPQRRTLKVFKEWFSIEVSTLIFDMLDGPILKDEF